MKGNPGFRTVSRWGVAALTGLGLATSAAWADPVPEASPPPLLSGFQFDWVEVNTSPHSINDALNALAGTGGFTIVNSASEIRPTVELNDGNVPFTDVGDPLMAVRVTGFIELAAGSYTFAAYHDDGARLVIGGQNVIEFPTDTSPTLTLSNTFTLPAGVYSFQAIGWEQGGQFVFNIGTWNAGTASIDVLAGSHAAAVPEPGAWALWLAGLGLLGWMGARRRAG